MINSTEDLSIINSFLSNFDTSVTEIGIFDKYLVLEDENKVVAFLNYSLIYDRSEINYIYVDTEYRMTGKAGKLIDYLIQVLNENRVLNITLEVRESNLAAINFYKKHGFVISAIREKYYNDENAILMLRELG